LEAGDARWNRGREVGNGSDAKLLLLMQEGKEEGGLLLGGVAVFCRVRCGLGTNLDG
jgi:hypothetical protein